jgi:hypothetical protein
MARAAVKQAEEMPASEPVTETITYTPGQMDPSSVKWGGHTFHANVAKELTGQADGSERERLNLEVIERARDNPHFKVASAPQRKSRAQALPKTPAEYRAYAVEWFKDSGIEHADQLIARFARDRELQLACEVGSDDFAYLGTLFMPRLNDLAKADDLNPPQVASLWISHGFNVLPW